MTNYDRQYQCSRHVVAGCFHCYGIEPHWEGPNAQGVAARHHDATGHSTWVDVTLMLTYGTPVVDLDWPDGEHKPRPIEKKGEG